MLSRLRTFLIKRSQKKMLRYVENGGSVFTTTFRLRMDMPRTDCPLSVGKDSIVQGTFIFESDKGHVKIGNESYIGGSTFISRSSITVGNHVTIAWGCTIYDHNSHSLDFRDRRDDITAELANLRGGRPMCGDKDWSTVKSAPIVICDDAWIGMNCIVLKGVTIGEGAVVGAGSVVTHDVPAWTVVAGNPACVVKQL